MSARLETYLRAGRLRLLFLVTAFALLLCLPSAAFASPGISTVTFNGSPTAPEITLTGTGFGSEPAPSNLATTGYTGYDYGNALYFCDNSNDATPWCAWQNDGLGHGSDTIGLVVNTYTDTSIDYTLGSIYAQYYPQPHLSANGRRLRRARRWCNVQRYRRVHWQADRV